LNETAPEKQTMKHRVTRRLALSTIVLFVGVGAGRAALAQFPPPEKTELASPIVEVAMDLSNRLPIVEARVNGQGPFRFLVDTGLSTVFLIDDEIATQLKLRILGRSQMRDGSGIDSQTVTIVRADSISMGEAVFSNCFGVIFDLDSFPKDFRLDGVIGFPAFKDCVLTLDYPRNRLILQPPSITDNSDSQWLKYTLFQGSPEIAISIAEVSVHAIVDSGSTGTIVAESFEKKIPFHAEPITVGMASRATGMFTRREARAKGEIKLGSVSVSEPIVQIYGTETWLGYDLLQYFSITFDQKNQRLRFTRSDSSPIVFPPLCYAGFGALPGDGGREVEYVLPQSPAQRAGLRTGDLITAVNGKPAGAYDNPAWWALFEKPRRLSIVLNRGEETITVSVDVVVAVP